MDGGATANNLLMQFQADILETQVVRPKVTETTALGAAYLAGLATGFWDSIDTIRKQWQEDATFKPTMPAEQRTSLTKNWQRAVKAAKVWADEQ